MVGRAAAELGMGLNSASAEEWWQLGGGLVSGSGRLAALLVKREKRNLKLSFDKILKHTGPSVRCGDTTDNFSVDERSRECDVLIGNADAGCLGMSGLMRGFFTLGVRRCRS